MSTQPNVLTNEDILRELNSFTNKGGNEQKPTINIGGVEIPADNVQAIQAAINEANTRNQSEFSTIKTELEQLRNSRVVKPEEPTTTQQQTQQTQNQPQFRQPRKLTTDEWSKEFVQDPQRVLDESIARMLGVEGSGSETLKNAFGVITNQLQQSQLERNVLLKKQQELDERITVTQAERAAESFLTSHPDFEVNKDNQKIMEEYLTMYELPATEKNLGLVYNQAVADGKLTRKQETQTQQNQQGTQMQQRSGVPRLGGQSSGNIDDRYIVEQASKLSADEQYALLSRLKAGEFQR